MGLVTVPSGTSSTTEVSEVEEVPLETSSATEVSEVEEAGHGRLETRGEVP